MPTDGNGTAAVEIRGLVRRFGEVTAVDGLDLTVPRGVLFGFLGPNGAGKSTTIKVLTGILPPTEGTVRILGRDVVREPEAAKRRMGAVLEEMALFDRLTGLEHLELVGRLYGLDRADIRARSEELVATLALEAHAGKLVADMSHGTRKRLALAAALLPAPEVLLLDEPFEGMDPIAARAVRGLLRRLVSRGVTVFLTSHVLEIVERLCTHVAIVHRGRLAASGELEALRREAGSLEELFVSVVGERGPAGELAWLA